MLFFHREWVSAHLLTEGLMVRFFLSLESARVEHLELLLASFHVDRVVGKAMHSDVCLRELSDRVR